MTTIFEKIWSNHVVATSDAGEDLLYIDRHMVHDVSSPQAFEGLRENGRVVHVPLRNIGIQDHNVPTTTDRLVNIPNAESAAQIKLLRANTKEMGMPLFDLDDPRQGIVHVVAPEQGLILPGSTAVCGDSHTATLGAMGAVAWGIGTSEVEHVLATQALWARKPATMGVQIDGALQRGVFSKDIALAVIHLLGTGGGVGHAIEYRGTAVEALSIEARLTLCNMTIEAGSRFGLVAPDATTIEYLRTRVQGAAKDNWDAAVKFWLSLRTDSPSDFAKLVTLDASKLEPRTTWGTTPADSATFSEQVDISGVDDANHERLEASLKYMGLRDGQKIETIDIDVAFIGSCTNSRLEDLRIAASVLKGRKVASHVRALAVPGSTQVKKQAEAEGIAQIFVDAGFEWRESGCSMCVGMNGDALKPGQRSASTSNRNFENRQGPGGRTHLMSPASVAAAAIRGSLTDPREFL